MPARQKGLYSIERLAIGGHKNLGVPNTFFRQDAGADKLVVVYPGLSYRCAAPLLWYPTRITLSLGADVLWVDYAYDMEPDWGSLDGKAQKGRLFEDSVAAFQAAMKEGKYVRLVLIGKSLGPWRWSACSNRKGCPITRKLSG